MLKVLLIVVQGKPEGKTIPVAGPVFRIGRGMDCHLRPNSEEVSRNHAELVISDTEAVVRDLGSRNGTRVNGKLLTGPHRLKSGELLQIGPLTFAIAIQGVGAQVEEPRPAPVAAGARAGTSLDDVPPDQIDAWLVSDHTKPTPDRPSGVYDGDTLTLESYKEVINKARKGSSGAMPVARPPSGETPTAASEPQPKTAAAGPAPAPTPTTGSSSYEDLLAGIEALPEGSEGPVLEAQPDEAEMEEQQEEAAEDEFIDESNPFYAAKKAAEAGAAPKKPVYEDSSTAASDILKRMLERRRAPR